MSDEFVEDEAGESLEVAVPYTLDGMRIDRALAILTGLSRAEAQSILEDGRVQVNDKVVTKASFHLEDGQQLVAHLPVPDDGFVLPEADVPVDIVVEDEQFLIINKRADQVVHPGAGRTGGSLIAGVLARYPEIAQLSTEGICEPRRPGVVHRLDRGTSGLLVVARTEEAFDSLSDQLADRTMGRTYLGLVEGHVVESRGVVDAPLGRSTRTPTMMTVRSDGRPARTGYEVIQRLEKPRLQTLLRLRLDTGRTHQIRVHLSTIGHSVVNDSKYGHRRDKRLEQDRFYLHSAKLTFLHPVTGETVTTIAPMPDDLRALTPDAPDC
ncbi:unannotated protein [freshwater metagenome]|uniref:Unannotated protein n=1 Tax=freshwater metagenome TaxID=449393 RepID=A0A6J7D059_9ZZZZ|nr:RluA family pseudouridine synthase [Actinomycetota bacterium]MUH57840.1 RluA family pseudouridine synthase [Actinomycetota bacterium]